MPLRIREARLADRDHVERLHRALYVEHRVRTVPPHLIELCAYRDFERVLGEDVEALLTDPGRIVLLADLDGQIVGYATGRAQIEPGRLLPRRGVVEDWYVLDEERRQGTGSKLIEALVERLRQRGCQVLESRTWAANTGARRAHLQLGFEEDVVIYRRRLD